MYVDCQIEHGTEMPENNTKIEGKMRRDDENRCIDLKDEDWNDDEGVSLPEYSIASSGERVVLEDVDYGR